MARQKQSSFDQFVSKKSDGVTVTPDVEKQAQALLAEKFNTDLQHKLSRLTVEETHTRTTFLLRNDLKARLDNLAEQNKRGYKTEFINKAIEMLLDAMENQ